MILKYATSPILMISMATLLLFSGTTLAQSADNIIGKWENEDNTMVIEIYKESNTYLGKIIQFKKNKQIGKSIIWDLKYNIDTKRWEKGKVQKPDMHHAVDCFIKLESKNTLLITGYHGMKALGSTEKWIRKK